MIIYEREVLSNPFLAAQAAKWEAVHVQERAGAHGRERIGRERERERKHLPLHRSWRLIRAHADKIFIFPYVAESIAITVCVQYV